MSCKPTSYKTTTTRLSGRSLKGDPEIKEAHREFSSSIRIINITIQHLHININSATACMSLQQPSGRYMYAIFLTSSLEHIIVRKLLSMHER